MHTVNDFQKLLGDINWLRPFLRLTTGQLQPLFQILQGDSNPSSRHLTPAATQALKLVDNAIQHDQVLRLDPQAPVSVVVCSTSPTPTGVLW